VKLLVIHYNIRVYSTLSLTYAYDLNLNLNTLW